MLCAAEQEIARSPGYLASQPDSTVSPAVGRVRLLRPLPSSPYRFAEIQPLHGVSEKKGLTDRSRLE